MYYKLIYNGVVIDVQNGLDYVTQSPTTQGIIGSDKEEGAFGIVSSDGSEIWHLDSLPSFLNSDYRTVIAVSIEKDEYDALFEELSAGREIFDDTSYETPGTEPNGGKTFLQYMTEVEADNDAILIDHEYRLTLLELGLSDY